MNKNGSFKTSIEFVFSVSLLEEIVSSILDDFIFSNDESILKAVNVPSKSVLMEKILADTDFWKQQALPEIKSIAKKLMESHKNLSLETGINDVIFNQEDFGKYFDLISELKNKAITSNIKICFDESVSPEKRKQLLDTLREEIINAGGTIEFY